MVLAQGLQDPLDLKLGRQLVTHLVGESPSTPATGLDATRAAGAGVCVSP
jgi:hypothetical protein